jgi:hypothetical protein
MARDTYEDVDQADAEAKPDAFGSSIIILTTVVLLAACYTMQKALEKHFQAGMFAPKQTAVP